MNLTAYIDNATNSELIVAAILILAGVFIAYMLFKILKYVMLITMIISGLFFFDVLNKEMFSEFDKKYKITESIDAFLNEHAGKDKGKNSILENINILKK